MTTATTLVITICTLLIGILAGTFVPIERSVNNGGFILTLILVLMMIIVAFMTWENGRV